MPVTPKTNAARNLVDLYAGTALGTVTNPVKEASAPKLFELPPDEWMGRIAVTGHSGGFDGLDHLPVAPPGSAWVPFTPSSGHHLRGPGLEVYQLQPAQTDAADSGPSARVSAETGIRYELAQPYARVKRDGEYVREQWTTKAFVAKVDKHLQAALDALPDRALPHRGTGLTFTLSGGMPDRPGIRVETDLLTPQACMALELALGGEKGLDFMKESSLRAVVSLPHVRPVGELGEG